MPFDANSILNTVYSESLSTEYKPVPEGEWQAFITDLKTRAVRTKNGDDRIILDCTWEITDPTVIEELGRDHPTVRQSIFLDTVTRPDGSMVLDTSEEKNVRLGRLREALHQNQAGVEWRPEQMKGVPAIVTVSHRVDGDRVYADVVRVAPLS